MNLHSKQNRPGFTLVELLTVVAIMGLLMAASLPAYIKVSKGAALRSAVAQVRSTLSLARQYAIANNEVVYFIIAGPNKYPNTVEDYSSYPDHADKCLRAYAVYSLGKDVGDDVNPRKDDLYLTAWEYLPDGIVFDYFESDVENDSNVDLNIFAYRTKTREIHFPRSDDDRTDAVEPDRRNFHYISFKSDGRASFQSETVNGGTPAKNSVAIVLADGGVTWDPDSMDVSDELQYQVNDGKIKRAIRIYERAGRMEVFDVE